MSAGTGTLVASVLALRTFRVPQEEVTHSRAGT